MTKRNATINNIGSMNFRATKQPIPEPIIPAALSRGAPSLRAKYPITAPIRHTTIIIVHILEIF